MATVDPQQADLKPTRTRTKVACLPCRSHKRKCDGEAHCGACFARGLPLCCYTDVPPEENEREKKKRADSRLAKTGGQQQRNRSTQVYRSGNSSSSRSSSSRAAVSSSAAGSSSAAAAAAATPMQPFQYAVPAQQPTFGQITPEYFQVLSQEDQHNVLQLVAAGEMLIVSSQPAFSAPAPQPAKQQSAPFMSQINTFSNQQGFSMPPTLGPDQPDPRVHPFFFQQNPPASGSGTFQQQNNSFPQARTVVLNHDQQQHQHQYHQQMPQQYSQPPATQGHQVAAQQPQVNYHQHQWSYAPASAGQHQQGAMAPQMNFHQHHFNSVPDTDMRQAAAPSQVNDMSLAHRPTPPPMYHQYASSGAVPGPSGSSHDFARPASTPSHDPLRHALAPVDDQSVPSKSLSQMSLEPTAATEADTEMDQKPKTEEQTPSAEPSQTPEASTSGSTSSDVTSFGSAPLSPEAAQPGLTRMPAYQPPHFANGFFGANVESSAEQPDIVVPPPAAASSSNELEASLGPYADFDDSSYS